MKRRLTVITILALLPLIAAGILYPFWGILLSPIFAAAVMSFSSVSVGGCLITEGLSLLLQKQASTFLNNLCCNKRR
jgi:cation transport ATPase